MTARAVCAAGASSGHANDDTPDTHCHCRGGYHADRPKFYRDLLGFNIVGESENYGTEQEHLNNVFGARLHITSLRAAAGPGIEFLEYLAPRDGRPFPADEHANDLLHWQTRLVTSDAATAAQGVRTGQFLFVSSGAIMLPETKLGLKKGVLVRDPDGHVMYLMEQ